jgi:hypothetical protein
MTVDGRPLRLRLVAALSDSVFQGELIMSDGNFRRLFPGQDGYRVFLVNAPPEKVAATAREIEDRMSDVGAEVTSTAARLAEFHRVENTYLSTFQTLGGLGLLLGTVGLATVVLRNALERRRELALLGAVGYRRQHSLDGAGRERDPAAGRAGDWRWLCDAGGGAGCRRARRPHSAERRRVDRGRGARCRLPISIVATRTALRGRSSTRFVPVKTVMNAITR